LLVTHIVVSVSWLGINVGNLALVIAGLATDDPDMQHAVFTALYVIGGTFLIPVSLLALTSGVLLAWFTRWGLFRYRWVVVKLTLTLIAVVLVPVSLLPGLRDLSELLADTPAGELADLGRGGPSLLAAGLVSTTMYTTNVVLSVLKPWGRTKRVT
jgi:hypothetical protein